MIGSDSGLRLLNLRESPDVERIEAVRELWRSEARFAEAVIERRASQLLFAAVAEDGEVAGVSTTYLTTPDRLRVPVWALRVFVSEARRQLDIGRALLFASLHWHEMQFVEGVDTRGRGLYLEIENPLINRSRNDALWPETRMIFVGYNRRGDVCRVTWFPGATI
jgi:GNAT superfamily N-acetyltransferase